MDEDQFERVLADVSDGRGASSADVAGLSHLLPHQTDRLRPVWESLTGAQKRDLISSLHREETDSLRLEFNSIYHLAMDDADPEVRQRGIEATIEDTTPWLLGRLLSAVEEDPDPKVRAAAAAALEPFAMRAELGELDEDESTRIRLTLLETIHRPGERVDVRAAALAAAGYFSDDEIRREIRAGYGDEELRLQALRSMGHSADPAWLDTVVERFEDHDDAIRRVAAEAAGEIGDEMAVPGLTELIDDPAIPVRLSAIAALGQIGGEDAQEALVYALEDKREQVREAAAGALEQLEFFDDPLGT